MMNMKTMLTTETSDAQLVAESLAGNREAFGGIVARYQNLICSLAYSGTGSLSQSEDLAQETFIAAWRQLAGLREPAKLRSWLCGIARNLIFDALKAQGREPSHGGESLEEVATVQAPGPEPAERVMSKEEMELLWRSIERIPEIYREPLVLFYREHQSVETVARNLELTEDAVKQRLSRGRKLLQEEMLAFVEGALARTSPGKVFTLAVLAALPALTISAKAATMGAAAKGGVVAKTAAVTGLLSTIMSPAIALMGVWVAYRMNQAAAQSEVERNFNKGLYKRVLICMAFFFVAFGSVMSFSEPLVKHHAYWFTGLVVGISLSYFCVTMWFSIRFGRARKKMLADVAAAGLVRHPRSVREYRSRLELLGLPFIHIRLGDRTGKPVKAWIAGNDSVAVGVLFAYGGVAIAPICFGGVSVGLISLGGVAFGGFAFGGAALGAITFGGFALGGWCFGGLAIGWQAFGGCALAWNAACGGMGIAHDYAAGETASALQMNNDAARDFINSQLFFQVSDRVFPYLLWLNLLWIVPMLGQWWWIARKKRVNREIC